MSSAMAESTAHTSVRSKPPYSAAFHHASRKLATMRHCPLSPWAMRIRRSSAACCALLIPFILAVLVRSGAQGLLGSVAGGGRCGRFLFFGPRRRMRRRVDPLQLPDRDLCVDLSRLQVRVPQHLLDVADVGAVLQHQCGHRVPEHVAGAALADLRGIHMLAHQVAQVIQAERLAGVREEHCVVVRLHHKLRPRLADILLHPGRRAIADRNDTVLLAFPLADRHRVPAPCPDHRASDSLAPAGASPSNRAFPSRPGPAAPADHGCPAAPAPARLPQRSIRASANDAPDEATPVPMPDCAGCGAAAPATGTTPATARACCAGCGKSAAAHSSAGNETDAADSAPGWGV